VSPAAADRQVVPELEADRRSHSRAFAALVAAHPEARIAALADDGFCIPMPASMGLPAVLLLPVPAVRATMIDLLVPGDTMRVIECWEQLPATGTAQVVVHTRRHPDRLSDLTFFDLRPVYGVLVGVLTDSTSVTGRPDPPPPGLEVRVRPRTATVHKTRGAVMTGVDQRTTAMLGWRADELIGKRSLEFLHPDDHERALSNWMDMLATKASKRVRLRHLCADGGWLWVELENIYQVVGTADDDDVMVITVVNDISDEMAAYEEVDRREKLFRRLTESLPIGLLQVAGDRSVVYANPRLDELLELPGSASLEDFLAGVADADRPAMSAALEQTIDGGDDGSLEIEFTIARTGQVRRCEIGLIALTDREGIAGALVCVTDVTASARLRAELEIKATYDELTGCHNRASVMSVLDLVLAGQHDRGTGVIFIDLDQFKPVNDRLGHAAGDELLVHVARRLAHSLRAGDTVGRIGGDEFLLVCPHLHDPAELDAIAGRVYADLHGPVGLAAGTVTIGASIGTAISDPGSTSDSLVAAADAAMYQAKRTRASRPLAAEAA
jgi:diguanylate cyclase (GGDEF)-like protein/PAS domain S-box-containing protein